VSQGEISISTTISVPQVDEQRWFIMTPELRLKHMAKVRNQALYTSTVGSISISGELNSLPHFSQGHPSQSLSVQLDSFAGSVKTPFPILEGIWKKAAEILNDPMKISSAPGCSPLARMVESKTRKRPHLVMPGRDGKFMCDADCPNYKAFGICSHVVSAAEANHMLSSFIDLFKRQNLVPNLSALVKVGMPTGSGRKGGEPSRKRKKKSVPESRLPFNPLPPVPASPQPNQSGFDSSTPQAAPCHPSAPPPL
jgi:hypothetical protein